MTVDPSDIDFDLPKIDNNCSASVAVKGMVGYRIKNLAQDKNVSVGIIMKELIIEGLKAKGLLGPKYDLSDMRRGY